MSRVTAVGAFCLVLGVGGLIAWGMCEFNDGLWMTAMRMMVSTCRLSCARSLFQRGPLTSTSTSVCTKLSQACPMALPSHAGANSLVLFVDRCFRRGTSTSNRGATGSSAPPFAYPLCYIDSRFRPSRGDAGPRDKQEYNQTNQVYKVCFIRRDISLY
jgi:hypothetical protein